MVPVVCPGIHPESVTLAFLQNLALAPSGCFVFPAHRQPAYSPQHLLDWLLPQPMWQQGVCFIAFSAGVVGALGAARRLHRAHTPVKLIAIDGWGVPLIEPFGVHRLSHDEMTHRTSLLLGPWSGEHFYADPPVDHLEMWRSPHQVGGRRTAPAYPPQATTAAAFLGELLQRYCASP